MFCVGYALAPKNLVTFIQPSFVKLAKEQGIELVAIDMATPLAEQGPFNCIVHKLYDDDWKKQLEIYSMNKPNVIIIDRPDAIEKLHNRVSMLEVVSQLHIPSQYSETCGVPNQLLVEDTATLSDHPINAIKELKFPVIAKPLVANASLNSHSLSLVFNRKGLKGLETPVVLQEFVNHGGVIFKVYVAGRHIKCVKRRSLPDVLELDYSGPDSPSIFSFSQISNLTVVVANKNTSSTKDQEKIKITTIDEAETDIIEKVEMPTLSFVGQVAKGMREGLGLHLFNFDMIRDSMNRNRYYVIDINYFPGYATMPSYETVLTDFIRDIAATAANRSRQQQIIQSNASSELDACKKI